MYEHFNPHLLTDAWWQHLLMLVVSGILGYIIGYRSRKSEIEGLEVELANLGTAVDDCERSKKVVAKPIVAAVAAPAPVVVIPTPEPIAAVAPIMPLVAAVAAKPDDLKVVEGIGPKIEQLFNRHDIYTFAQLADTAAERLKEILDGAGPNYRIHNPETWPKQSALARDGKWDELKAWQEELYKGKTS